MHRACDHPSSFVSSLLSLSLSLRCSSSSLPLISTPRSSCESAPRRGRSSATGALPPARLGQDEGVPSPEVLPPVIAPSPYRGQRVSTRIEGKKGQKHVSSKTRTPFKRRGTRSRGNPVLALPPGSRQHPFFTEGATTRQTCQGGLPVMQHPFSLKRRPPGEARLGGLPVSTAAAAAGPPPVHWGLT